MNQKLKTKLGNLPQEGYVFDKANHLHALDGKPLTGVTTVLSVIAKPALIQWAADETAKYMGWFNPKYEVDEDTKKLQLTLLEGQRKLLNLMDNETYLKFLGEARVQHAKRKKDAGTVGTDVHAEIEIAIKQAIRNQGFIDAPLASANPMVKNFINWAKNNNVVFLESEKHVYSRLNWFGGICDFVANIDGKIWIGDIKTSSGVYPEYFFQTAGYQLALQEMGEYPEVEGHVIVNCKKNGEFEVQKSYGYAQNVEAFKAALTIYRAQKALKATI